MALLSSTSTRFRRKNDYALPSRRGRNRRMKQELDVVPNRKKLDIAGVRTPPTDRR